MRFRVGPLNNTVPWSNGNDAWFTSRKRWFDSIRDYFDRHNMPRYAIGRATRLKPECLQVRSLLWVLKTTWLGRQLADHLGLEPGMLWVRLPPESLARQYVLAEQRSARLPVTQEIVGSNPIGDAFSIRTRNVTEA